MARIEDAEERNKSALLSRNHQQLFGLEPPTVRFQHAVGIFNLGQMLVDRLEYRVGASTRIKPHLQCGHHPAKPRTEFSVLPRRNFLVAVKGGSALLGDHATGRLDPRIGRRRMRHWDRAGEGTVRSRTRPPSQAWYR